MMQNLLILSKKYDVDCLIMDKKSEKEQSFDEIKKYSKNVFYFKQPNLFVRALNCLKFLILKKPIQNGYFYSRKMNKFVHKNSENYDGIFFMHMRTAQYGLKISTKKYIDCPDCITMNSFNEFKNSKGLKRLIYRFDYKNVKRFEATKYREFDGVFVINNRDKKQLIELDNKLEHKVYLLQNYVRDLGMLDNLSEKRNEICFLGRMAYGPNILAIDNFVKNIYPRLKEQFPNLIFNIYGGSVVGKIKKLTKIDGVIVHGYVENVAKEIQQNRFVVAPMISGSGTQNKILECMRLKKLVLTTQLGVDGLDNVSDEDIVVCNDNDDFVKKSLYFLSDESDIKKQIIEENAFRYVQNNFSFEISETQLLSKMEV